MATSQQSKNPSIAYVASSAYVFLNFFMETLREIKARGFDVVLFCPDDGPVIRFEAEGFEHVRIPMGRTINPVSAMVTWLLLHSNFLEQQPILVHSHTTTVHLISAIAARSANVPVSIATVHGHFDTGLEHLMGGMRAKLVSPWIEQYTRAVAALVDAYLVINKTEARRLERLVATEKLHYIEGGVGVDLDRFDGSSGKREARRRLRLPEGQKQVGFIGRLIEHKAKDLLTILDQIQGEDPRVGFLAVLMLEGDPSLEAGLKERSRAGRKIVVVRDRDPNEMPLIYKALDLLLLPSYREGASTVLMEAAAMRVPAVAYDIAGTRDIIDAGRTGLLVPVGDTTSFSKAVHTLLVANTRRRDMGAAARAKAGMLFNRASVQQKILPIYDHLIDLKLREKDA